VENMPWDCISRKYQRQVRYQEDRIRYLEQELKAAREEINVLKAGNSNSKTKDQDISDDLRNWTKPKKFSVQVQQAFY
jgi:septal ring factor EnvC (AmiA/AmiB activator)